MPTNQNIYKELLINSLNTDIKKGKRISYYLFNENLDKCTFYL